MLKSGQPRPSVGGVQGTRTGVRYPHLSRSADGLLAQLFGSWDNECFAKPLRVNECGPVLTYKVIGLAMAVHNDLGPAHRENTYHNAMSQRFVDAGLPAEHEPKLPIVDENGNVVNFYYPDHRVEQKLLTEYKAHQHPLTNDEIAQRIDYFAASDCEVRLLFNLAANAWNGNACFRQRKFLSIAGNAGRANRLMSKHSFIRLIFVVPFAGAK